MTLWEVETTTRNKNELWEGRERTKLDFGRKGRQTEMNFLKKRMNRNKLGVNELTVHLCSVWPNWLSTQTWMPRYWCTDGEWEIVRWDRMQEGEIAKVRVVGVSQNELKMWVEVFEKRVTEVNCWGVGMGELHKCFWQFWRMGDQGWLWSEKKVRVNQNKWVSLKVLRES